MTINDSFFSCDWGTSSFRLRLVNKKSCAVLAECSNDEGVASIYRQWNTTSRDNEKRRAYYLPVLKAAIAAIEDQTAQRYAEVPVVISGMISSSIGWFTLPYRELPVGVDGRQFEYKAVQATDDFPHVVLVISGLKTRDDVMRGEETQVLGALEESGSGEGALYILPGTHSKHVTVSGGEIVDFHTFMTGEMFNLFSRQSVLSESIKSSRGDFHRDTRFVSWFGKGLAEGVNGNILNAAFKVRSYMLLGTSDAEQNFYFLSGVLIGAELRGISKDLRIPIVLIGNDDLNGLYVEALKILGFQSVTSVRADAATIRGQKRLLDHLLARSTTS